MKTVKCVNPDCTQNDVNEYFVGSPDFVQCGVCQQPCELSEPYDDPEQPVLGQP